jgi:hypothetical protein
MFGRTAGTFSALVIGIETWLWESAGHEFAEQPSLGVVSPCHIQVGHENTSFGKPLLRGLRQSRIKSRFGYLDFLPPGARFGTADEECWLAQ